MNELMRHFAAAKCKWLQGESKHLMAQCIYSDAGISGDGLRNLAIQNGLPILFCIIFDVRIVEFGQSFQLVVFVVSICVGDLFIGSIVAVFFVGFNRMLEHGVSGLL